MSKAAHTPGPWHVGKDCDDINGFFVGGGGYCRANLTGPTAEREANARLIAAAPELLEALKEVVKRCGPKSKDGAMARAAIAKAEGRSND